MYPMTRKKLTLQQALPYILVIAGVIGIICSFMITYDKIALLENPKFIPNCNINPIISCGSVLSSKEGSAFGFPNSFIGLSAFAILLTIGMAIVAGAKFKRWFWLGLNIGSAFGVVFCLWLFYHSVYVIHALCPYCMGVWAITITTFWYVSLYNVDEGFIKLPKGKSQTIYAWVRKHHMDLLILWLLIIGGLILKHFWYYYGHYL